MKTNISQKCLTEPKKIPALLSLSLILAIFLSCEYSDYIRKTASSSIPKTNTVSNEEASVAIRDALVEGIKYSTKTLSTKDGYYKNSIVKINLPPETETIIKSIDLIPGGKDLAEKTIENMNRAAEDAAKESLPIFENAIKTMSISDGINIVKGGENAATDYFKNKTYSELKTLYASKMNKSLDKPFAFNISANSSWKALVDANNEIAKTTVGKLAGMKVVKDRSLGEYATGKALDGLFYMAGEEEKKIRQNPFSYASEMIKKVFGALKKGII